MLVIAASLLPTMDARDYESMSEAQRLAHLKSKRIVADRSDYVDGGSIDPMRLRGPVKVVGSPTLSMILGEGSASLDVTEFSGSFYVLNNVRVIARNADLAVRGGNLAVEKGRLQAGMPLEASGTVVLEKKGGGTASRVIDGLFEELHLSAGIAALSGRRMVVNNREILSDKPLGSIDVWMSSDNVYVRGRDGSDRLKVVRDGGMQVEISAAPWVSNDGYAGFRPSAVFDNALANSILAPNTALTRYLDGKAQEAVAATVVMGSAVDQGFCRSLPDCVIHAPDALGIRASKGQMFVTQLLSKPIAMDITHDGFGLTPSIQIDGQSKPDEEFSLVVERGVPRARGPGAASLTATILGPYGDGFRIKDGRIFRQCAGCKSERMVGSVLESSE